jgi:hypothetical protein
MIRTPSPLEFLSMSRRSAKAARLFGLIMIIMVSAWDMDAMRPHIAAHSWYTLAFVALFLIVHLSDYFTVGQLVTRLDPLVDPLVDPLALVVADGLARAGNVAQQQDGPIDLPGLVLQKQPSPFSWRKLLSLHRQQPSLHLGHPTAKLYTFTAVTTTAAQASGATYPITQQHYVVEPD